MALLDPLIRLENITKKYFLDRTEIAALDNLSCLINRSDFVVLAGPSGSGKTTLLNIIGSIDKPSSGRVFFEGSDITDIPLKKLNHLRLNHIGFVFQSFNLIPVLTSFENIELPLLFRGLDDMTIKDLAEKYLRRVGLIDKRNQK